jgi:predicted esterase
MTGWLGWRNSMRWIILIGIVSWVSVASADTGTTVEHLRLMTPSGAVVECRVTHPSTQAGPLPAAVIMGNVEHGAGALDFLPPVNDAVLAGCNYPDQFPRQLIWSRILEDGRRVETGIEDMVTLLGRLREILAARKDVDPSRLTLIGVSMGSPLALMAGSRYEYSGVALLHGFGNLPRVLQYQFERSWRPRYGPLGVAMAWLARVAALAFVDLPDPESDAVRLRAHQHVLLVYADTDKFVPPEATESLINALRRSQARVDFRHTPGGHVRGGDQEKIRMLFDVATAWMREQGLLGPARIAVH